MKIKSLKEHSNYNYDNFDIKITRNDINNFINLQERISILAFIMYEKECNEEYPEDGIVDWNNTFIDEIYSGDQVMVHP